jgi:acetate kinase
LRGSFEGLPATPRFSVADPVGATRERRSWPPGATLERDEALDRLLEFLHSELRDDRIVGVGHRVVHGGSHTQPLRIDPSVLEALEALVPLAPLHQPHNLAPMVRLLDRAPQIPQVACFDTAFHQTNSDLVRRFALPAELHDAGVRRYGFHGLSYEFIAAHLDHLDPRAAGGRTIVLHLGNGASLCALHAGKSVATTMGLTALDGVPMGTRCGALDPGVLLWLMGPRGMDVRAVERLLYDESGLLGVSGISSDMRVLMASADPAAARAIDLFVHRIGREVGSLAAELGGVDALVFTAGIGENSPPIRARICEKASWLGVTLDPAANEAGGPRIHAAGSPVACWVIPTHEELMIARHTRRVLAAD